MKFMVDAECGSSGSTINKSYNGVDNGLGATTIVNGTSDGFCRITFPHSLTDRYIQVSASHPNTTTGTLPESRSATCRIFGNNSLLCKRFNGLGNGRDGRIMILVY